MDQKETKKISDGSYKYVLSDTVIIWELVNKIIGPHRLVNPISLENLRQYPAHFVSPSLEQREADMIYEVLDTNGKPYLYILIEHQSVVDKLMPFRMFLYAGLLYHDIGRKSQKGSFPNILPILLYNGKQKWNPALNIDGLILSGILKNNDIGFHCTFIDEKRYPVEKLLEIKGSMAAIIYMEQLNKEMFKENRETVVKNLEIMIKYVKPPQMLTIAHWINHMFRCKLSKSEVIKIARRKGVVAMLTEVLDDFRQEGILEGTEKGWQEGRQDERRKIATAMVEQGFDEDSIRAVTGLSLEEIQGLAHT